jgi:hypothetical protein
MHDKKIKNKMERKNDIDHNPDRSFLKILIHTIQLEVFWSLKNVKKLMDKFITYTLYNIV